MTYRQRHIDWDIQAEDIQTWTYRQGHTDKDIQAGTYRQGHTDKLLFFKFGWLVFLL